MNGGNNGNSPGQVPDSRLDMIMQELRQLRDQNQQLRGQIDYMAKGGGQQPTQQQRQSKFAPEVQQAIHDEVQALLRPLQEQFTQQQGYLFDQVDYTNFMVQYGKPQYEPYMEKVEQIRRDAQSKGQWLSREQALQYAYFQETGKKPAPENTKPVEPQQTQPVFDAFLGQWVDAKGQVVAAPGTVDADKLLQQAQQPQQVQQPQGVPVQQMQQQFQQQQPQQFQQQPMQQQFQQQPMNPQYGQQQGNMMPQLPSAMPPEQMRMNPPAGGHMTVDVTSSDQALAQWEQKYGDVPL